MIFRDAWRGPVIKKFSQALFIRTNKLEHPSNISVKVENPSGQMSLCASLLQTARDFLRTNSLNSGFLLYFLGGQKFPTFGGRK